MFYLSPPCQTTFAQLRNLSILTAFCMLFSLLLLAILFILVFTVPANNADIVRKAKSLKKFNKLPQSFLDQTQKKTNKKETDHSKKLTAKV